MPDTTPAGNDDAKRRAAQRAAECVMAGMALGLGTGSTATHFVAALGGLVKDGLDVVGVPTSARTAAQARSLGIRLTTLDETPQLDLTVDGADAFDASLRLLKGGGGALLREKIVAASSSRMIVIADHSKQVAQLGRFPLPVEVDRFGLRATTIKVEQVARDAGLTGAPTLRRDAGGEPTITDGGHLILDCAPGAIENPERLAAMLDAIPGVIGHGLFIGLATAVIVADDRDVHILGRLS